MSTGGITEWACKEETIYGEIKETKNSCMKKKKAFLTHTSTWTRGWSGEHSHTLVLEFLSFLPAFAHPEHGMVQKCCKNILLSMQV